MNMYRLSTVLILVILMLPFSGLAKESTFEKAVARGLSSIEQGDTAAAISEFQAALAERPDDPLATLYLGIARNQAKDPAAETVLKKALLLNPESARANLELAILYLQRNLNDEAQDYLDTTLRLAPDSPEADKARELLQSLKSRQEGKRWWFKLLTGVQYDTNVLVNAVDAPLPPGFTQKSDWRWVINPSFGYMLLTTKDVDLAFSGSVYQSLHQSLNNFDVFQPAGELSLRYRFNPNLSLKAGCGYDYITLGGDPFAADYTATLGIQYLLPAGHSTNLDYRLRISDYRNSELYVDNSDRNGTSNFIGLTQNIQFNQDVLGRIGYGYEEETARQNYWQFSGNRGLLGLTIRLPHGFTADLSGEAVWRDYAAPYPSVGVVRRDNAIAGSGLVSYAATDYLTFTAGYYYMNNNSNIASFEYQRGITSLFAFVRF